MLISPDYLRQKCKVDPEVILHVGAHLGEEENEYLEFFNPKKIVWIEANPKLAEILRHNLRGKSVVIQGVVWSTKGKKIQLNVTNDTQSSSVFELNLHKKFYPDILVEKVIFLKSIILEDVLKDYSDIDFINLDIQGAEYEALKGLRSFKNIKFIYCEVNKKPLYHGITLVADIDVFLKERGFVRIYTVWAPRKGWGDALYANLNLVDMNKLELKKFVILSAFKNIVIFIESIPVILRLQKFLYRISLKFGFR